MSHNNHPGHPAYRQKDPASHHVNFSHRNPQFSPHILVNFLTLSYHKEQDVQKQRPLIWIQQRRAENEQHRAHLQHQQPTNGSPHGYLNLSDENASQEQPFHQPASQAPYGYADLRDGHAQRPPLFAQPAIKEPCGYPNPRLEMRNARPEPPGSSGLWSCAVGPVKGPRPGPVHGPVSRPPDNQHHLQNARSIGNRAQDNSAEETKTANTFESFQITYLHNEWPCITSGHLHHT